MQIILIVLGLVMGLATVGSFVFGVYSLPMGLLLKNRKQALIGLACLLGALVVFFISVLLIAMVVGKMC